MSAVANLIEDIDKLTPIELGELVTFLEGKWGVSCAAPVVVVPPEVEAPVRTEFDVKLGAKSDMIKKMAIIKEVRTITGKSLTEAKTIVESNGVIKTGVGTNEAQDIKAKLEAVGAEVILS